MMNETFSNSESNELFSNRHIGPDHSERAAMLETLGLSSIKDLIDKVIPDNIRLTEPLSLKVARSEPEVLKALEAIAKKNKVFKSYIGMGYYGCYLPTVILRNLLENPAWYTAYTPYQPEISQGRLEALLNFQTMIIDLTGMEIANASLLDEATAAAEAMTFCQRLAKNKSKSFFVSKDCHPQTIEVIKTRAAPIGIKVIVGDDSQLVSEDYFGALLQYPTSVGNIVDYSEAINDIHAKDALVVMAADLLALTLLKSPGELGADVAIGTTQRFGVPMGFGGPHAAYFATRDNYKRVMPGRLVGVSVDSHGNRAYRLAIQTREQHIRREKATSNICTAQVLLANIAAMYAIYHGPKNLKAIAKKVHLLTCNLAQGLQALGYKLVNANFFDTLTIETNERTSALHQQAQENFLNFRYVSDETIGISLDETTSERDIQKLLEIFSLSKPVLKKSQAPTASIPTNLLRQSRFLIHPVFNSHHSETKMLRYLRKLSDKDLALDRTMIPLGSCTMKLNATTEMIPITWAEFCDMHPFAPKEQTLGYQELITDLEQMLCACTGYDAVSLQPNAGSQGEYAGLLSIRAYHRSRGENLRNICLIPSSAHGTNPATAQMVGMQVVVVECDEKGNVNVQDLKLKAQKYSQNLAALMITYPSTHGVFEESIVEICDIIHKHGGQVYIDGANMNAMVGLCAPGKFGGDVSHLNLHKTFCIPHGGGGPGIGPIGVKSHLIPFLPGHRALSDKKTDAVTAAPWGSAGILPITWAYISLMGASGLTEATENAILNANYLAKRLFPYFPVLYTGRNTMVAHECIIDLLPAKERTGITVEDVAKRLIDFGFHAPTMSFPVPGTLMIEPTESESKQELDRFCEAMIKIFEEIEDIANGRSDPENNPLTNAPHTALDIVGEWQHPYSRTQAVYPIASLKDSKYWPPIGRIDNVYGDRHLVCACPPLSDYK